MGEKWSVTSGFRPGKRFYNIIISKAQITTLEIHLMLTTQEPNWTIS